ncbi:uncharacterized protein LOC119281259 [Triticum dicoccoides]|uniref:uncharacterized protein LOC119281259 n=1 Tax=Triticum dicoccoides TaxID=85692 RepID=UPI00189047F0|nr:uncharacterized protein LOC119281259 [Triticum dicoccoides]
MPSPPSCRATAPSATTPPHSALTPSVCGAFTLSSHHTEPQHLPDVTRPEPQDLPGRLLLHRLSDEAGARRRWRPAPTPPPPQKRKGLTRDEVEKRRHVVAQN